MNALLEEGGTISDFNKRKELYSKVVKMMVEECPVIFTTTGKGADGIRDYVKGYQVHPLDLLCFAGGGLHYMWLEK